MSKQQMSPKEKVEYRKLQREMLQESLFTIINDLKDRELNGETRDANTPLGNTRGCLSGALSSIGELGPTAVLLAKEACESMLGRATRADSQGGPELAAVLREHVNKLSPIVADMLPEAEALRVDNGE